MGEMGHQSETANWKTLEGAVDQAHQLANATRAGHLFLDSFFFGLFFSGLGCAQLWFVVWCLRCVFRLISSTQICTITPHHTDTDTDTDKCRHTECRAKQR